jgi:hypothetical protein
MAKEYNDTQIAAAEEYILSYALATDRHGMVIRAGMEGPWPSKEWAKFQTMADVWDAINFQPCDDPSCPYFACQRKEKSS